MSVSATEWAMYTVKGVNLEQRMVLVYLSERHNDERDGLYCILPEHVDWIAERSGEDRGVVRKVVQELEDLGLVKTSPAAPEEILGLRFHLPEGVTLEEAKAAKRAELAERGVEVSW